MPSLPSGGGLVLALCLGLLEAENVGVLPPNSLERLELLARVFRVAFAMRRQLAADPEVLGAEEVARIHGRAQASLEAGALAAYEREFPREVGPVAPASMNTTQFCVMDSGGNAVSATVSLNTMFGSKLVVKDCGFLLNSSIDDFQIGPDAPNWYHLVQ